RNRRLLTKGRWHARFHDWIRLLTLFSFSLLDITRWFTFVDADQALRRSFRGVDSALEDSQISMFVRGPHFHREGAAETEHGLGGVVPFYPDQKSEPGGALFCAGPGRYCLRQILATHPTGTPVRS